MEASSVLDRGGLHGHTYIGPYRGAQRDSAFTVPWDWYIEKVEGLKLTMNKVNERVPNSQWVFNKSACLFSQFIVIFHIHRDFFWYKTTQWWNSLPMCEIVVCVLYFIEYIIMVACVFTWPGKNSYAGWICV